MTDDFAIEGEDGGYVPCGQQAAQLVVEEEGAISGIGTGFVPRDQAAASLPAPEREAIVGSGVGFVPTCEYFVTGGKRFTDVDPLATSDDGITWTARESAFIFFPPAGTSEIHFIVWAPEIGLVVAIGNGIQTSPDGVTWTLRYDEQDLLRVPHDGDWSPELGLFVVWASEGLGEDLVPFLLTSSDGLDWTSTAFDLLTWSTEFSGPRWVPEMGLFVALTHDVLGSNAVRFATSPDGLTWTSNATNLPVGLNQPGCLTWVPELGLLVAGYQGDPIFHGVITSPDGLTWTEVDIGNPGGYVAGIAWSPELNTLVTVGTYIVTSSDLTTWTVADYSIWHVFGVAWSPEIGLFVAVRENGTLATSPDGLTWTERVSGFEGQERLLCVTAVS